RPEAQSPAAHRAAASPRHLRCLYADPLAVPILAPRGSALPRPRARRRRVLGQPISELSGSNAAAQAADTTLSAAGLHPFRRANPVLNSKDTEMQYEVVWRDF